jgi:hypothetical protein
VAGDLVVAVAPSTGRFRPAAGLKEHRSAVLGAGSVVGHVTGGAGRADPVRCPVDAVLRSLLARPGQTVERGQPIGWLLRLEGGTS